MSRYGFQDEAQEVVAAAEEQGIDLTMEDLKYFFGRGTYRWIIEKLGISYSDGMDIGLFDLHQHWDREDIGEPNE